MTEFILGVTVVVLYRGLTIVCGLAIVYLGFVLFRLGVYERAGELKAIWGTKNLTLKQAAPGTLFALFGASVITATVWRGVDFSSVRTATSARLPATAASTPEVPGFPFVVAQSVLPDSIKSILKAAADGKQLTEPDRKALTEWLEKQQQDNSKIHIEAEVPKLPPG